MYFRSQCSVVCKWNYIVDEAGDQGWPSDLLELIGLQELLDNNASLIGKLFFYTMHKRRIYEF